MSLRGHAYAQNRVWAKRCGGGIRFYLLYSFAREILIQEQIGLPALTHAAISSKSWKIREYAKRRCFAPIGAC